MRLQHHLSGIVTLAISHLRLVHLLFIIHLLEGKCYSVQFDTTVNIVIALDVSCIQGPVVQSVVSLTSSLRVISLTVLADSIHNILIFFAEKMWVAFALLKLLTFFQQKILAYLHITI